MKPKKVVMITGASAGVGRAAVRAFARRGACIGLMARGEDGLQAARKEAMSLGGNALVLPVDVANAEQVEAAATALEEAFGPIDVWINNAMVSVFSRTTEMTAAEYKRVTEVTYLGYVYGTLAALRRMVPRDQGIIVQVGSALAYRGIPLQSAYCGAKHAVQGFTESVRCELLHDGSNVKITVVHLPALNTPQFSWVKSRLPRKAQPVPPIYQPELAADAIVYATKRYRREWHVGSSTAFTIAANKLVPGIGDWHLARHGFDAQQQDGQEEPDRPNNLNDPLPGDHGAHGEFDSLSSDRCFQVWLDRNRYWVLAGLVVAGLLGGRFLQRTAKSERKRSLHVTASGFRGRDWLTRSTSTSRTE